MQSVIWINSSKEIWEDLVKRYDRGNTYRLCNLLEAFHTQKQCSLPIDGCFTRLKILWDEILMLRPIPICTCDPIPNCNCEIVETIRKNIEAERVMKFVQRLNDCFESVRSKLLMECLCLV